MYILQVNQAVSDFSNERDKVVGQLREAEVASSINSLFAFYYLVIFHTVGIQNAFVFHPFHSIQLTFILPCQNSLSNKTILKKLKETSSKRHLQTV